MSVEYIRMLCKVWCFFIKTSLKGSEKGHSRETRHCRQIDAPSRKLPMSHCPLRHRILDPKRHSCGSPAPYSPDLSPYDFSLFPKLKNFLKGRHFEILENIEKKVTDTLKALSVVDFQHCYQKWEQRLHWCVAAQGNYFEGENNDVWKNKNFGK